MSSEQTPALRVLIAEDVPDAAESLRILFRLWGHDARIAATGPEAVELARDYQPDIGLIDLMLPGIDGFEVARQVRAQDVARSTVLIAVTGFADEVYRHQSRVAGFAHFLAKPVDLDELFGLLGRVALDKKGPERGAALAVPHADIVESAEHCLRGKSYPALSNVSCAYQDGALVLRGSVPTYFLKQVAQEAVSRLGHVVDNQIEVTSSWQPRHG